MHMSDALITPVVGSVMLISSIVIAKYSLNKVKEELETKIPLMAIMGAFIFAFQMINFTIPGTGSSGHIGGGLLLSIILGPYAGFLTLSVVLFIQALFFADGGVLALGCNLINLGFFTCFVTYPILFRVILGSCNKNRSFIRVLIASITASVVGLQLGSIGVVFETFFSGRTDLPLREFLGLMQSIHFIIGVIEGIITGIIVNYLLLNNPQAVYGFSRNSQKYKYKGFILSIAFCTLIISGVISIYASDNPDGLEWSISNITGQETTEFINDSLYKLRDLQNRIAIFPEYDLKDSSPSSEIGTGFSGILGSVIVFLVVFIFGYLYRKKKKISE